MRCKMRLEELTKSTNGHRMVFQPVTSGSEENKSFFKWTPSGRIELGIISDETAASLEVGAEYYVDFTKADLA